MSYRKVAIGAGVGHVVAGPLGAGAGAVLAGAGAFDAGHDMSDIPYGVHVEADHEDDEVGRRWLLRFLSEVPPKSHAVLRLLDDAGQRVPGRAPLADEDGAFVASAAIEARRCSLYVPFAAMAYTSARHTSLEVSVWVTRGARATPVGRAILDAALPPA